MPKKPAKTAKNEQNKPAKNGNSYSAKDIYVLEGLEPVRKRPGMYIGSTGVDGLHHLVWEVVDNSFDEAMAGYAKKIRVELLPENRVAVADDGRGIPVETHAQTKKSALETVMTTLHAGGKFGGESYKVAGGLHGVGVSVVCALSKWMRAEVCRDGRLYEQEYVRGKPKSKVKAIGKCAASGTKVTFEPDPEIFKEIKYDRKRIIDHLRQQAFLTKSVKIDIFDGRDPRGPYSYSFYFEGGLLSFLKYLGKTETPYQETPFYASKTHEQMEVEVAFTYNDELETHELSFANNIYTPDGGMHLTGFRSALTRGLNDYLRSNGNAKNLKDEGLTGDDVREGLVAVISVKLREPQFEGQTKARLGNPEARTAVESVVGEALKDFMERHPSDARRILEKCMLAAKARKAAKAAKDMVLRKGALEGLTLPGKLADCSSRDPAESELFVVEGDSAGGCFSPETKVILADGTSRSFQELVGDYAEGKQHFCYTIRDDGAVGIAPILNPRMTKRYGEILKVVLDTGEEITCTPDHKFMLRDGSYKEARNLTPDDSLMPFYRKYSKRGGKITIDGYEMIFQPRATWWEFTHLLADRYNLEHGVYRADGGAHRHHRDFNKLNNRPDNIIRLSREDHLNLHRQHADKTLRRPDVLEKVREFHRRPEFREKVRQTMIAPRMRALLSDRAKKQWENTEYKKFMAECYAEFYRTNASYRAANRARLHTAQKEYWSNEENVKRQADRVRAYFEARPEARAILSDRAKEQWKKDELRSWRAETTRQQWTPEFRAKRKAAYGETYRRKALAALSHIYSRTGRIDYKMYEAARRETRDRSLIRLDSILKRFFEGDEGKLQEAVLHYNHRIQKIIPLAERIDLYDLEVPGTHNFALASGVFVHNSAKSGRDRRTQAILPLKGKILNVEKARIDKMMVNKEIKSLVVAIGTAIADAFDISKIRYHKIILMTDADVDGAHIRTLLLTLFYRYFPEIIHQGYLYIAKPPLYRIQSGKEVRYAYGESEKARIVSELQKTKKPSPSRIQPEKNAKAKDAPQSVEADGGESTAEPKDVKGINIQRYKGLGEMNPDQLWGTTMHPENRVLKLVSIEDAEEADRLFDTLMGEQVEPRKQFIQAHALSVRNLDI